MKNKGIPFKLSPTQRRLRYTGRKSIIGMVLALLIGVIVVADRQGWLGQASEGDFQKYDNKIAKVVHVADGDTICVNIPDDNSPQTKIRLWGVDTPEIHDPRKPDGYRAFFGPEASDFTKRLTLDKNITIQLEPCKNSRDKYKRLLAWIILEDGRCLNKLLVQEGYAYADPRFENQHSRPLARLQKAAMKAGKGLWGNGTPKDIPDYYSSGRYKLP